MILTPSCGDKRKNQPEFAQNSKGWLGCGLMDFYNFHPIYVFKVKESTADILTELPSDLENPSQLPVWKVLMILLWIVEIFKLFIFRGQGIHCYR